MENTFLYTLGGIILFLVILYYVIKNAVKNGINESKLIEKHKLTLSEEYLKAKKDMENISKEIDEFSDLLKNEKINNKI